MLAEIAARTAPLPPAAQPQLRAEPAPARVAPETKLAAVEAVESRAEADAPEAADAKPDSTWYDGYETAKSPIPPAPVNTPTLEQLLSVHCAAPERRRNITLVSCR